MRRRRPPHLLLEAVVVAAVLAAAAVGVYLGFRGPSVRDVRPLAGRNVAVTRAARAQYDVSAAVSPSNPRALYVASADSLTDARLYESRDDGRTWTSAPGPPPVRAPCGISHPAVAAGPNGMLVYASLVSAGCQPPDPVLEVAVRPAAQTRWRIHAFTPRRGFVFDLDPSIAVDARGTVSVVWPRLIGEITSRQVLLFTKSADAGRSWSVPTRVGRYDGIDGVAIASDRNGEPVVAVADGKGHSLDLRRSTDGGKTWTMPRRVTRLVEPYVVGCGPGSILLAGQPQRCVGPSPNLAIARTFVALAYSEPRRNGRQGVFAVRADTRLERIGRPVQIGGADALRADQFLPALAFDGTARLLWACFYDTTGDPTRKSAWFTCAHSTTGGRSWSPLLHAASRPSNEAQTGGDRFGYGDHVGLAALGGVAHPVWTDNRNSLSSDEDVYTARIPFAASVRAHALRRISASSGRLRTRRFASFTISSR